MGIHQSIATEAGQRAHYAAIRAKLFGKPSKAANVNKVLAPVIEVQPIKARQLPMWEMGNVTFDAHVVAYRQWQVAMQQLRQFSTAGNVLIHPRDFIMPEKKRSVKEIVDEVLKDFPDITFEDLKGPRRARKFIIPRHLAWYEVHRQRPDMSYPQIGRAFGGFDHTSILSAVKKISAQKAKELAENGEIL